MIHLLLDKSTLQSLSYMESIRLSDHYYSVFAPTLFVEIMGDLKKAETDEERVKEIAKSAKKIHGISSSISANYRTLIEAELLGNEIQMDCKPIVLGGKRIPDPNGKGFGLYFDEEPEHGVLRRWSDKQWSEAELAMADLYRRSTTSLDLTWLTKIGFVPPVSRTLNSLCKYTFSISVTAAHQKAFLRFLLADSGFSPVDVDVLVARWTSFGSPNLALYAPYTLYCVRVLLFFYLGVAAKLIPTRPTNRVDVEYLFYAPFSLVFSSSDRFLRSIAPFFLGKRQAFIWGVDFKLAMKSYVEHFDRIGWKGVEEFRSRYGVFPLLGGDHVTTTLHERYFGPLKELPPKPPPTPEQKQREAAQIREWMAQIDQVRGQRSSH